MINVKPLIGILGERLRGLSLPQCPSISPVRVAFVIVAMLSSSGCSRAMETCRRSSRRIADEIRIGSSSGRGECREIRLCVGMSGAFREKYFQPAG